MKRLVTLLALVILLNPAIGAAQTPTDALPARAFERFGSSKLRHGSRILCLAFTPDGQTLVAGGGNDPVRLWNPKTGAMIREINEPWVQALALTDSGETLVYGGFQKVIKLWNFKLAKEIGRLEGHKTTVKAIAVSPDKNPAIASGSQDGKILLWQMANRTKAGEYSGHTDEVTALAFSPTDSNLLASAGGDRVIHFWNIETSQSRLKIDAGCGVRAIAFSPDGKALYAAGDDYLIRRWDVATGKLLATFKGHEDIIVSLFVQGDTVVSGALDKTIRFWNANTIELKRTLPRAQGDCDALAITKNGDFVATAGNNNTIHILEAGTGKEVVPAAGIQSPLVGLALSSDNGRLFSATADGRIIAWDARAGKLAKQWDAKQTGEINLALTHDGKMLASAASSVYLWNADTGAEFAQLPIQPLDAVVTLAFSPDGNMLALGQRSAQIDLWDLKEMKVAASFKYPGSLYALAWSPDGKMLAAAGGAKIFLWDPQTKSLVRSFDVKEGPAAPIPLVKSLAFGPDSKTLAAGGWDAVIRIYNLNSKNPSAAKEHRRCEGHLSAIYGIAFSADGRSLVSGSFDKTVRLWEAFSGKQIALYTGHIGEVVGVAFTADGRSVYSAAADTVVFHWDVPGLANNGKLADLTLPYQELENAWTTLTTEDTPIGHKLMWQCIASSKQAIPQMAKKVYLLEPERVKKLFEELDSAHYPTRQAAMKELEGYGRWMEGRYDAAMANPPSLEYKRRVEILKEKVNTEKAASLAQRLRLRRFMLMCEQVGSPDAIDTLRKLAAKGPEEELRDEAAESLRRLKK